MADGDQNQSGSLTDLNTTQQQGVRNLGLILQALRNVAAFSNFIAAPATATSLGTPGQVAYDSTHFYVCIATNTWVRVVLATF